jgi:hypothetical protein
MRTALAFLCMAAAAAAQQRQGQEYPGSKGGKLKSTSSPPEVSLRGGLEVGYDDNIIDLSEKQLREFKDRTKPQKYRIKEEDDFVASPWAEVRLKARLFGDPTTFGFKAQANAYQENSFANDEEYRLFVHQALGRHEAGLQYEADVDVYHRELEIVVPGPNLWESAFYTDHELEAFYLHRAAAWLSVRPFAGWAIRDFESPFGHRDLRGPYVGIRPTAEAGPFRLFLQYRYETRESDAGGLDADTAYDEHQLETGAAVELFQQRLELSLKHRVGFREYTTSNDPAIDPSHAAREDRRQRTILEARLKVHRNWSLEARYQRKDVDSDRPSDTGVSGEGVDSERNTYLLGVSFAF